MTAFAYPEKCALHETFSIAGGDRFRYDGLAITLDDVHELILMQRIKQGDFDARQKLITGGLRHVLRSNKRYARNGVGLFDLLKAGNRGLAHALESFEPENDGRFSAYAALCIHRHIECTLNPGHHPVENNDNFPLSRHPVSALRPAAGHLIK